jgi:hypothetical protein
MVKSNSPNAPSSWLIFLRPRTHASPAELADILFLPFSLFALVAELSQCLCSETPYLSIRLYRIYVCYTNITLYIALGLCAVSSNRSRSRNVLPVNTRAHLYTILKRKKKLRVTAIENHCSTPWAYTDGVKYSPGLSIATAEAWQMECKLDTSGLAFLTKSQSCVSKYISAFVKRDPYFVKPATALFIASYM